MSASDSWKLLIFRDGKREVDGPALLRDFLRLLPVLQCLSGDSPSARDGVLEALLRAGELECGLADADDAHAERVIATITDALASALVSAKAPQFTNLAEAAGLVIPDRLSISPPEGFCYYALHPLDYADLLSQTRIGADSVAVIGIRSIGTTLSAVVRAWCLQHGIAADRITVRPTGHPFDRRLRLSPEQEAWISSHSASTFLIVDEGPGLSGSSFLAVAEALTGFGIDSKQIVLLPSSEPDLHALIAPDAARRWQRFRTVPLKPTRYIPQEAGEFVGAGLWRSKAFPKQEWPPVWNWTERQKYLSRDGKTIFRFDGLGHYGCLVRERAQRIAAAGWGPSVESAGDGFTASPWIHGRRPVEVSPALVEHLGRYCAWRAHEFPAGVDSQRALEEMARVNIERIFELEIPVQLEVVRPVIADSRMGPQEWIVSWDGPLLKVDAASDGDDHFFPGPTDIAWDIAGAIIEWHLPASAAELLVATYKRESRDQEIDTRLGAYMLAYGAFRLAFALSAAQQVDELERSRFSKQAERYRAQLQPLLDLQRKHVYVLATLHRG